MLQRPGRIYAALVPALVAAWFVSGLARGRTPSTGGLLYRVGATGWLCFILLLLAIVIYTVALGVAAVWRRRATVAR
jgi:hypothetical protein